MFRGIIVIIVCFLEAFFHISCENQLKNDPHMIVIWATASKTEHWRADNAFDALKKLKKESRDIKNTIFICATY